MGQILHASAKTTHAIRGELLDKQASVVSLAKRFGINALGHMPVQLPQR